MQSYFSTPAEGCRPPAILNAPPTQAGQALFPAVPTLLATRLQLELLLAERSIDLRAAAGIILNDLGATLEIFRHAGEGAPAPARMEDCLAGLSAEIWIKAVSADAVERIASNGHRLAALTGFWERARARAYACWLIAQHMEGMCPEEAYLVGLLEEATCLPGLLDWAEPRGAQKSTIRRDFILPQELIAHWCLPEFLQSLFAEERPVPWQAVLRDARLRLAGKQ